MSQTSTEQPTARRRNQLWRVFPIVHRYGWDFWTSMVIINCGRFSEAIIPLFLKKGIDGISRGQASLAGPVVMILGLAVVRYLALNFGRRRLRMVSIRVGYDLRQQFYWHLQRQDSRFFTRFPIGDLMARAINDIGLVRQFVGMGVRMLLLLGFSGPLAFVFMLRESPSLTLLLLPTLPPLIFIGWFLARRILTQSSIVQEGFSDLSAQVQENLNGIRTIQSLAQEKREIQRFKMESTRYADSYFGLMSLNSALTACMTGGSGLVMLIVLGFGGQQVIDGSLSLGTFTAFIFYLALMLAPVKEAGALITLFQRAQSAAERLWEILDQTPSIQDIPGVEPVTQVEGAVSLRHLSYRYPPREAGTGEEFADKLGELALQDLSIDIGAGEMVVILGRVGAGKSTLLRLIVRSLDPQSGQVFLDGQDIRTFPLAQLRSKVALVAQDPFLFAASLRENIAYDDPTRSLDEIWRAAETAGLSSTIRRYPKGLGTLVGERGVTLSGGQKQRASLARGLIRETPVLLLDDCFSAVDTETEEFILSRLRQSRKGRSTILVSHRVSTARYADRIIVLENGRIAESGTHRELLAHGGLYASLERMQGHRWQDADEQLGKAGAAQ